MIISLILYLLAVVPINAMAWKNQRARQARGGKLVASGITAVCAGALISQWTPAHTPGWVVSVIGCLIIMLGTERMTSREPRAR